MAFHINIQITIGLALWLFFFWLWRAKNNRAISFTSALTYFTVGIAVLALPMWYTTDIRFSGAAWRVSGVTIGLYWFFSCLQLRWHRGTLLAVLYGILFLISVQAVIAGQQLLMPYEAWVPLYGRRVYGTFFQPNVLASLIATGVTLTLGMLLLPGLASKHIRLERLRRCSMFVLLAGFSALLVCIQSRAGWLGGVAAVLLLFRFGRLNSPRTISAAAALTGGVLLGSSWLLLGHSLLPLTDHAHSNLARWSMLRDTLAMIGDKPWQGWGYGGFEYDFQHFRINQTPATLVTEIARHPHNEILLWIVEGGLVGFAGVMLVLAGMGTVIRKAIKQDRIALMAGHRMAGMPTALCFAVLPMAIHTLLEFPFYLSTLHFAIFLLLLAIVDRLSTKEAKQHILPGTTNTVLSSTLAALALGLSVLAGFTLKGEETITQVEKFGMEDIMPLKALPPLSRLLLEQRISFDEQVGSLMTYNRTRDEHLLEGYSHWAQTYLQQRIDKNVYASLIQVLRHQKDIETAERYRREAALFFPTDARFAPADKMNTLRNNMDR
ncbi:MAG: Wzy polymerase domain-containing protein [Enterobacter asburiae]|uniref:PglL family O-oligosaccharyltransferase n=1 Tax=Serratia liquefaciens TaxID=614 RepID=UPI00076AE5CE|nr:Wzy polymerase domain-containing protein [Serratia liquefaciens]AMG98901.1 polymerase [Serratia liquefaciens]MDU3925674.1 Wzy polymerase domain-containing protein [Enterobacter asburiae]